jgi:hypothetical protein
MLKDEIEKKYIYQFKKLANVKKIAIKRMKIKSDI